SVAISVPSRFTRVFPAILTARSTLPSDGIVAASTPITSSRYRYVVDNPIRLSRASWATLVPSMSHRQASTAWSHTTSARRPALVPGSACRDRSSPATYSTVAARSGRTARYSTTASGLGADATAAGMAGSGTRDSGLVDLWKERPFYRGPAL